MIRAVILCIVSVLVSVAPVFAHNPILEPAEPQQTTQANLALAVPIGDPTFASAAIYGRLGRPDEVDIYRFTPSKSEPLPFDALVPVRSSLSEFRPTVALIAYGLGVQAQEDFPVHLPKGYGAIFVTAYKSMESKIPKDAGFNIQIQGHTDTDPIVRANFASNWELSTSRATSVVRFLVGAGIPTGVIVAP